MSRSLALPILVATMLAAAAPAAAAVEIEAAPTRCDFHAWSKDPDPAGLNVRAAPRRDAPVVARLAGPRKIDGETFAVEFQVTGGKGGWLRIEGAEFADYGSGTVPVYAGPGWVAAALVDVSVEDERLRRSPSDTAAIVDAARDLPDGSRETLALRRILACDGRWIEIEAEFLKGEEKHGRAARGWATRLCGNQVTTCP